MRGCFSGAGRLAGPVFEASEVNSVLAIRFFFDIFASPLPPDREQSPKKN